MAAFLIGATGGLASWLKFWEAVLKPEVPDEQRENHMRESRKRRRNKRSDIEIFYAAMDELGLVGINDEIRSFIETAEVIDPGSSKDDRQKKRAVEHRRNGGGIR